MVSWLQDSPILVFVGGGVSGRWGGGRLPAQLGKNKNVFGAGMRGPLTGHDYCRVAQGCHHEQTDEQ